MTKRQRWLLALSLLVVALIWGQSVFPPSISREESGFFARLIVRWFGGRVSYVNHVLRKCAHFGEYTILGLVLSLCFAKRPRYLILCVLAGFAVAFLDETIQIFSSRGPAIADVWLDTAGVLTGTLLAALIHRLRRSRGS